MQSEFDILRVYPARWLVQRFQMYALVSIGAGAGFLMGTYVMLKVACNG